LQLHLLANPKPLPIDPGAVGTAQVFNLEPAIATDDTGMAPGDGMTVPVIMAQVYVRVHLDRRIEAAQHNLALYRQGDPVSAAL
jgi:hypothetical protein